MVHADVIQILQNTQTEIERKVIGQRTVIRHTLAACLAGGHVLFEDVPGTGKTTLASAFATVLGLKFTRVQGTPDLLPGDLVGTMVFHPRTAEFTFRQGPLFTQVLLMDEINRATPRTQSALLEAMAEARVSVDGQTHLLEAPFFVMATANPLESQGVFPLPEAQLDRFLVQLKLGYTSEQEEFDMVQRVRLGDAIELSPQLSGQQLLELQHQTRDVTVVEDVLRYIVRLCRATRAHERVRLGASPRAVLALTSFCQALALLSGRDFVTPDDVHEAWIPVMRHRVQTHVDWSGPGETDEVEETLLEILSKVTAPVELAEMEQA